MCGMGVVGVFGGIQGVGERVAGRGRGRRASRVRLGFLVCDGLAGALASTKLPDRFSQTNLAKSGDKYLNKGK